MWNLESTQESVRRLKTHLIFMKNLPEVKYNHSRWFTECGTPSCSLGWAAESLKGECEIVAVKSDSFNIHPNWAVPYYQNNKEHFAGCSAFRVDIFLSSYLFGNSMEDTCIVGHNNINNHNGTIKTTIKRLELVLNYMRRRLACFEVDNGDWQNTVVGQKREELMLVA